MLVLINLLWCRQNAWWFLIVWFGWWGRGRRFWLPRIVARLRYLRYSLGKIIVLRVSVVSSILLFLFIDYNVELSDDVWKLFPVTLVHILAGKWWIRVRNNALKQRMHRLRKHWFSPFGNIFTLHNTASHDKGLSIIHQHIGLEVQLI